MDNYPSSLSSLLQPLKNQKSNQFSWVETASKNQPIPLIGNHFPSINNLMTYVSKNMDVKARYRLASTDNVSRSVAKCWYSACPAYLLISHILTPYSSFQILKLQTNHNHKNVHLSDIQLSVNLGYKLEERISVCQQVFNQCEFGNYFYNFLQSYKVISKECKNKHEYNQDFMPYLLPSICSQKIIPVTFRVYKAKFNHLKRLQLSILKISIMERDLTKLQSLHYLNGSREENDLMIVMMVLVYSFLSNVKNPIIKLESRILQSIQEIQQKRKNGKKLQEVYQGCVDKLLTLYENHFNANHQMVKFQALNHSELNKLQSMHSKSEETYQVFCSKLKEPGVKVSKIRKWNVLINEIEKNRVVKIRQQFGKKSQKFDDSKFIQIDDIQNEREENDQKMGIKLCGIQKKETSIIEQQIVGRYESCQKNKELQDLRQKLEMQKLQNNDQKRVEFELVNLIDLI